MLLPDVLVLFEALHEEGVDYVVFGAVALNIHGIARATEDLDLFVRPDPENVARLRRALSRVYDDPHVNEITAKDLCGAYPAIRYVPPQGDFYVDVLTRLGEAMRYEDLEAETVSVEGIDVKVVTPRQLHRMKRDTVRPQDRADAQRLRDAFGFEEDDG